MNRAFFGGSHQIASLAFIPPNWYIHSMSSVHTISICSLFLYIGLLLWCGDVECLSGESDDLCSSVLCTLLTSHESASGESGTADDQECACACHVLTIAAARMVFEFHPPLSGRVVYKESSALSYSTHPIYHPPRAS